jgi:hypothetical protein
MFVPRKDIKEDLWTVGYYIRDDEGLPCWFPLRDFASLEKAEDYIHYLNGGKAVYRDGENDD